VGGAERGEEEGEEVASCIVRYAHAMKKNISAIFCKHTQREREREIRHEEDEVWWRDVY
jgi:hypothetical protein